MVREVTWHGAFLIAGGRAEEGKPRQPKEQVAEPIQQQAAEQDSEGVRAASEYKPSETAQPVGHELRYEVDKELNRVVIKILDGESGDVIRQIPAEELIRLAKILEQTTGDLLSKHV